MTDHEVEIEFTQIENPLWKDSTLTQQTFSGESSSQKTNKCNALKRSNSESDLRREVLNEGLAHKTTSFELSSIMPMVCFIDAWLEAIKHKEVTYNYKNKT